MNETLTESYLWDTYWGLGYSLRDVSKECGDSHRRVLKKMKQYGIPRRPSHGGDNGGKKFIKGLVIRDEELRLKLGLEVIV
jgi:hypothetical protein